MVKYLVDRFGLPAFLEFYEGGGYFSHEANFGITAPRLAGDWYDHVRTSPDSGPATRYFEKTLAFAPLIYPSRSQFLTDIKGF